MTEAILNAVFWVLVWLVGCSIIYLVGRSLHNGNSKRKR